MSHWADKYVGGKHFFNAEGYDGNKMCLLLVLHVLNNEKGFDLPEKYKQEIKESKSTWFDNAPRYFMDEALKVGTPILNASKLREFDVPFFEIEGKIKHCGVMIDKYGKFLHQLKDMPTRVERISSRHWAKRFYCGIRCV